MHKITLISNYYQNYLISHGIEKGMIHFYIDLDKIIKS